MKRGKIGIDLGTTYCCCGVFKSNRVELAPYNEGTRTIASHVYFNPDSSEVAIGNVAKNNMKSVGQTVYDSKRFIGKKFKDGEIQEDIKHWPFKVHEGDSGEPIVRVMHNGKERDLTANDISTEILKKIKETADQYFGQNPDLPTEAVITVPAYFNVKQRQNTIEAAKKAGLEVKRTINEPTAAAVAYAYQRIQQGSSKDEEKLLIYDFGGGTFDVSIIEINFKTKDITVKSTGGDSHLGGEDIDQNLVKHFSKLYKNKCGKELNEKQRFKLKKTCEAVKCLLSSEDNEEAIVESETLEDADVDTILTRETYNDINKEIFDKTMVKVDEVLKDAKLSTENIDYIVLVGGSSRIPKVHELLRNKFPSTTVICKDINPDEVVAYGACLFANMENMHFKIHDIIAHTISTDIEKDGETVLYPLIPRNTPIPYEGTEKFCFANFEDGADHIDLSVFEGEGRYPNDKGVRQIDSKPFMIPSSAGRVKAATYVIETKYNVDENGVLKVEVFDRQTKTTKLLDMQLK